MKRLITKYSLIGIIILASGCSNKKNTFISRNYHNLTARYNVYFNAKESYKKAIKKVDKNYKYNYSDVLPVFDFEIAGTPDLVRSDMDRTIKKCNLLISKHSITARPKNESKRKNRDDDRLKQTEFCKWVDDAYLLMGKAYLYRNENDMAIKVFTLIKNQYFYLDTRYYADLWLIRTYLNTNRLDDAYVAIETLSKSSKAPEKVKEQLQSALADYYLKSKNYDTAIEYLIKAIETSRKKTERERLTYILAQSYNETKQYDLARETFNKVIKMNPGYEMIFNAKVNLATSFDSEIEDLEGTKKALTKMLYDEKNIDFIDQIYYGLAEIERKTGHKNKALEFYTKSAHTNSENYHIKSNAYEKMSTLNFDKKNYIQSYTYIDSSLFHLQTDHADYGLVFKKRSDLKNLAENLSTIQVQDSLLGLARLPKEELDKIIEDRINIIKAEEEAKKEAEAQNQGGARAGNMFANRNSLDNASGNTGKWYFYNPGTVSFGRNEFKIKWGTRKLEDNWRRRDKKIVDQDLFETAEADTVATDSLKTDIAKNTDIKSKDYYLSQIPFTDTLQSIAYGKIATAMFNAGNIYKDDIHDYNKSLETYELFIRRFNKNELRPIVLFYAYQLCDSINDKTKQNSMRSKLISEFPDSKYSKYLQDPDFLKKIQQKEQEVEMFYQQTYNQYITANYNAVLGFCDYADENFKNHKLYPNFEYLRILTINKTRSEKLLREDLKAFIKKYRSTDIAKNASNVLAYLEQKQMQISTGKDIIAATTSGTTGKVSDSDLFIFAPEDKQMFAVVFDTTYIKPSQIRFDILNFNVDYFLDESYDINYAETLHKTIKILTVTGFKDIKASKDYYDKLQAVQDSVFTDPNRVNYFIISTANKDVLTQEKNLSEYLKFFTEKYK